jgi:hypothetical protein
MSAENNSSGPTKAERHRKYRGVVNDETPAENTRETDHYKAQYVMGFVNKWDELIDWDARAESEGDFFIEQLRERGSSASSTSRRAPASTPSG